MESKELKVDKIMGNTKRKELTNELCNICNSTILIGLAKEESKEL